MSNFEEGQTVQVLPSIGEGKCHKYYGGDVGVLVEVFPDTPAYVIVNFGEGREKYWVHTSEIEVVDPSQRVTPVLSRIRKIHQRQTKHPYLSKGL